MGVISDPTVGNATTSPVLNYPVPNGTSALRDVTCRMGSHIQWYLSPDTSEHTQPQLKPEAGIDLSTLEGWKAELTLVTAYIRI